MPSLFSRSLTVALAGLMLGGAPVPVAARPPASAAFEAAEASIPELQAALASGRTTSRQLVAAYLARIAAYNQAGPKLNAIVTLNPEALAQADALDRERAQKGPRGPLHGVPILVKDNYDTADMPTSGGVLALATLQPGRDATQVARLRAAGAIILGKTTMHELAAGTTTISSLTGQTRNPYDPARTPGGSSGGTGASVAASFAAAGMGSDTCGSIRIPSAYQNLFGLRATRGLSSRAGVMPLSSTQDVAGPLARSVTDLAIMMDATAGPDPRDATTKGAETHVPQSYLQSLRADGLKGARIGVLRDLYGTAPEDREGQEVVDKAFAQMRAQGADLVEVHAPGLEELLKDVSVIGYEFKGDLAAYLAAEPHAPVASLSEIIARGLDHDELDARLRQRDAVRPDDPGYARAMAKRAALHALILKLLADQKLDVIVYPTTLRRPPLIGDDNASNCQLSAATGLPAMAVPAGFSPRGLPVGLELMGGDFSEPTLFRLAYGWEQTAHPRKAPFSTPPLVDGHAPAPLVFSVVAHGAKATPLARVRFRYDPTTATLETATSVTGLGPDRVIAVTLQRGRDGGPGPVIAQLVTSGRDAGEARLVLPARDRDDLLAGRLYVDVYTQASPLGVGRAVVTPARQ